MGDKSYVSLEQRVCLICGMAFDTGALLLDRRLRASMERHTTTGWGLCPDHQALADSGYVALIEVDPQRSGMASASTRLQPEQAHRTGRLVHLRRAVFSTVLNVSIEDQQVFVFIDSGVMDRLLAMVPSDKD